MGNSEWGIKKGEAEKLKAQSSMLKAKGIEGGRRNEAKRHWEAES